jgi:hypothetical protein
MARLEPYLTKFQEVGASAVLLKSFSDAIGHVPTGQTYAFVTMRFWLTVGTSGLGQAILQAGLSIHQTAKDRILPCRTSRQFFPVCVVSIFDARYFNCRSRPLQRHEKRWVVLS